jgi:hypothetical protein
MLITILSYAVLCPIITLFWVFCIGAPDGTTTGYTKGRILTSIGKRITENHAHQDHKIKESKTPLMPNIWKITGICSYCTNFWVTTMGFLLTFLFIESALWWMVFPITLLSHFFVALFGQFLPTE